MEQQLCVLLYSKYSKHSKRYIEILKQSPIDFVSKVNLKTVCIDNEEVRQRILNSQKIDINYVPCILLVYPDGGVEKYEGGTAFKWAEEIIRSFAPPSPIPKTPPTIPKEPLQIPHTPKKVKKQTPRQPKSPPRQPQFQQSTSIDDLNSYEEEEEGDEQYEDNEEIKKDFSHIKPPAPIRSGVGNYDVQGEFGIMEEPNRNVTRGIKSSTELGVGGKGNLMATAMAMQKSREKDDPPPPPGAPSR